MVKTFFYSATIFVGLSMMTLCMGCLKAPDLDKIPEITRVTLSKKTMKQGNLNNDSLIFTIEFTDGDGNFGSDRVSNIFIVDGRNKSLVYEYKAPMIPEQGTSNGVKGRIFLTLYTLCCFTEQVPSCCTDPLGCPDQNTFPFFITIKDRENNASNEYLTDEISLICF